MVIMRKENSCDFRTTLKFIMFSRLFGFTLLICLTFVNASSAAENDKFEMRIEANPATVAVNGTTTIRGLFKFPSKGDVPTFSPMWASPTNDIGEKCTIYPKFSKNIQMKCKPDSENPTTYELTIKSVQWEHRGNWHCRYAQNSSKVFLDVQVPPPVENVSVDLLSPSVTGAEAVAIVAAVAPKSERMIGKGTLEEPFDMRNGQGVRLTCSTGCGHPVPDLAWRFDSVNRKVGASMKALKVSSSEDAVIRKSAACKAKDPKHTLLQAQFSRTFFTNCTNAGMDGLTAVTCTASGDHYPMAKYPTQAVYFLCPGEAQNRLLTGEIVAIGFGGGIAILLLIGAIVVINRAVKDSRGTQLATEDSDRGIVGV